mmetsp:Transcript_15759/g.37662  ORF Transcript_15759/g.37662 Transcript_15759/m.37662 type:complete len:212 (+) Transcript_15759:141-776(+)
MCGECDEGCGKEPLSTTMARDACTGRRIISLVHNLVVVLCVRRRGCAGCLGGSPLVLPMAVYGRDVKLHTAFVAVPVVVLEERILMNGPDHLVGRGCREVEALSVNIRHRDFHAHEAISDLHLGTRGQLLGGLIPMAEGTERGVDGVGFDASSHVWGTKYIFIRIVNAHDDVGTIHSWVSRSLRTSPFVFYSDGHIAQVSVVCHSHLHSVS